MLEIMHSLDQMIVNIVFRKIQLLTKLNSPVISFHHSVLHASGVCHTHSGKPGLGKESSVSSFIEVNLTMRNLRKLSLASTSATHICTVFRVLIILTEITMLVPPLKNEICGHIFFLLEPTYLCTILSDKIIVAEVLCYL